MDELGDFTLTIAVGNDGMSEPVHVAGALRDVAGKVSRGDTSGTITDVNGNSVGTFEFANA